MNVHCPRTGHNATIAFPFSSPLVPSPPLLQIHSTPWPRRAYQLDEGIVARSIESHCTNLTLSNGLPEVVIADDLELVRLEVFEEVIQVRCKLSSLKKGFRINETLSVPYF